MDNEALTRQRQYATVCFVPGRKSPSERQPQRASKTREDWLRAAAKALEKAGPAGVRVEALARQLSVTKGSFYWHFEDRQALLLGLLDTWEALGTSDIITRVEARGGDPRAQLLRLWDITSHASMGPELAIRDWARGDERARQRVQRVDQRRLAYLAGKFRALGFSPAQSEQRSLLLYSLLIGAYFIQTGHDEPAREKLLLQTVKRILEPV